MREPCTEDPHSWGLCGMEQGWPVPLAPGLPPAWPCRRALCHCCRVSHVFPLGPSLTDFVMSGFSLSPLFLTLSDTPAFPAAPAALSTNLLWPPNDGIGLQISGNRAAFFPTPPQPLPSINEVPGEARPVLRPPACPVSPFLGHTAGKRVQGAGKRVGLGGSEIKVNPVLVLRKK